MALIERSEKDAVVPDGVETVLIGWKDVREFQSHKTLFIAADDSDVKIRVYQGDYDPKNKDAKGNILPTYDGARIDYDFEDFTVAAGTQARLPIYDDGVSEMIKVTGEGVGGDAVVNAKITGPVPYDKRVSGTQMK